MNVLIRPGTARGTVAAPPSKSMAHRLLICAALADGESTVRGVDRSEDILATADCLAALGASLTWEGNTVRIRGCDPRKSGPAVLRCRESGSTLRFMIPLCLLSGSDMRLEGSETLLSRPLSVYEDLCREQGLTLRRESTGLLAAGRLAPGEYSVPGGISSQFITGLLFALPLLPADSRIRLIPPVESRSYLSLTLQALHDAGVMVSWTDENTLLIPGNAVYRPLDTKVEGDYSNAAFFEALNCAGIGNFFPFFRLKTLSWTWPTARIWPRCSLPPRRSAAELPLPARAACASRKATVAPPWRRNWQSSASS